LGHFAQMNLEIVLGAKPQPNGAHIPFPLDWSQIDDYKKK
jgi:hypothetical protein